MKRAKEEGDGEGDNHEQYSKKPSKKKQKTTNTTSSTTTPTHTTKTTPPKNTTPPTNTTPPKSKGKSTKSKPNKSAKKKTPKHKGGNKLPKQKAVIIQQPIAFLDEEEDGDDALGDGDDVYVEEGEGEGGYFDEEGNFIPLEEEDFYDEEGEFYDDGDDGEVFYDEEDDGMDEGNDNQQQEVEIDARAICKFGATCYRKNAQHILDFQHPGSTQPEHVESSKNTPFKQKVVMNKKGFSHLQGNPFTKKLHRANSFTPASVADIMLTVSEKSGVGWTAVALLPSLATTVTTTQSTADNTTTTSTSSTDDNITTNTTTSTAHTTADATTDTHTDTTAATTTTSANTTTPPQGADFKFLSEVEVKAILSLYPELKTMYDRTGSQLVENFILSTLKRGLPAYQMQPGFTKELIQCINYIFFRIKGEQDKDKRKESVMLLAEAYQSCQAVQAQCILSLYSKLMNIEKNFQAQVSNLLEDFKSRVLDRVVIGINPDANEVTDDSPTRQAPHIRSAYLLALNKKGVTIMGKKVALMDHSKPHLSPPQMEIVYQKWRELFDVDQFVDEFVTEINQGVTAKFIDHAKLYQWTNALDENTVKFEKHSIFYDESNPQLYDKPQKEEDQLVLPYVSKGVAVSILAILGIIVNNTNKIQEK